MPVIIKENIPRLDGSLIYLVPFNETHLYDKRYFSWLNDYEVMKMINRPEYLKPVEFDTVKKYFDTVTNSKTDIFWAICYKPEELFVGTLRISSVNDYAKTADVGILVGDRNKWGKGIATDAIHTACCFLFNNLKLRKLTAGAMAVNTPMLKVFEKLGFKREGIFREQDSFEGKYCDHIYFGCFKNEFKFNL